MKREQLNGKPLRLDPDALDGEGLSDIPHLSEKKVGNPRKIFSQSQRQPQNAALFVGDIWVGVYEGGAGKIRLENTLYDEYVEVLEGTLILTDDASGAVQEIPTGGHVIVPKGYSGTWEMVGDTYRELVISETRTLMEDAKAP